MGSLTNRLAMLNTSTVIVGSRNAATSDMTDRAALQNVRLWGAVFEHRLGVGFAEQTDVDCRIRPGHPKPASCDQIQKRSPHLGVGGSPPRRQTTDPRRKRRERPCLT
jgi:hypothetical protein